MKAIFKLAFAFVALLSFSACSDVPMPYEQPGDNNNSEEQETGTYLDETFSSDFGKFTNVTVKGNAWAIDYQTAKATGYDNTSKTTTESEAYLVSSALDLSKSTAAYLQFDYILRYVKNGQTENKVLITDNYTGSPSSTTWTDITGTLTEGSDWTTFSTYKKNIPAAFLGKNNVVVALMYSCTTSSSTIELKNLIMKDGTVEESSETPDTPDTPDTGDAKGSGTEADPYNVAAALKVVSALGSDEETPNAIYVEGTVKSIKQIETSQYGNANYYITDDGNNEIYIFQSYYLGNRKFTADDKLSVGDKVVIYGKFINYKGNTPETVGKGASYIYSLNGKKDGEDTTTPDTPATGEAVTINGTTVTLTNTSATAGTETTTVDLNTVGLENSKTVTEVSFPDGAKVTFAKGTGTNTPAFYDKTKGVRVYLNNTLTFNASKKIAKIEFSCDKYGSTSYVGNAAATVTFSGNDAVYTNSDPNAEKGGVQLRVQTITITYAK